MPGLCSLVEGLGAGSGALVLNAVNIALEWYPLECFSRWSSVTIGKGV